MLRMCYLTRLLHSCNAHHYYINHNLFMLISYMETSCHYVLKQYPGSNPIRSVLRLYHTYYSQYELYTVLKRRHGECIYYHRVTMEPKRKQSFKLDLLLRQQFTPNYKEVLHLKLNASTVIAPTSNLYVALEGQQSFEIGN